MYIVLRNYNEISPLIDTIIRNNGSMPLCRTGNIIDYILSHRIVNVALPLEDSVEDHDYIAGIINSQDNMLLSSSDTITGTYYIKNYKNRASYSSFRIEKVNTDLKWTIIKDINTQIEYIHYLDKPETDKFNCYSEECNYYLLANVCSYYKQQGNGTIKTEITYKYNGKYC